MRRGAAGLRKAVGSEADGMNDEPDAGTDYKTNDITCLSGEMFCLAPLRSISSACAAASGPVRHAPREKKDRNFVSRRDLARIATACRVKRPFDSENDSIPHTNVPINPKLVDKAF